jgi:hypothetical protein
MRMPNFHHPDFFISKFGRDPKVWTISQVHDLWIEAKRRNSSRYKAISDHLKYIKENLEPTSDGEWRVYFYQGGALRGYKIRDDRGGLSYSIIDPKVDRRYKIDTIIGDAFEMGTKMHYLTSLTSRLEYDVFEILSSMIHEAVFSKMYLKPHYTRMDFKKVIRISGRTYLFDATSDRAKMEEIKESEIVQLD